LKSNHRLQNSEKMDHYEFHLFKAKIEIKQLTNQKQQKQKNNF